MIRLKQNQGHLTSEELADRWRLKKFDLLKIVIQGELWICDSKNLMKTKLEGRRDIKILDSYVYDLKDILDYERNHPELRIEDPSIYAMSERWQRWGLQISKWYHEVSLGSASF